MNFLQYLITKIVTDKQGCKLTELSTELAHILFNKNQFVKNKSTLKELFKHYPNYQLEYLEFIDMKDNVSVIIETVENMIIEKELVSIDYTLPNLDYKKKSIIFPKYTQLK